MQVDRLHEMSNSILIWQRSRHYFAGISQCCLNPVFWLKKCKKKMLSAKLFTKHAMINKKNQDKKAV